MEHVKVPGYTEGSIRGRPGSRRGLRSRRSREQVEAIVLGHLARSTQALSAYDIVERTYRGGEPIVPNQVYRTLARLVDQQRAYRVESLSAYMPRTGAADACLICDGCHAVVLLSAPDLVTLLIDCAGNQGFTASHAIIETHGLCKTCATGPRERHASADDHQ